MSDFTGPASNIDHGGQRNERTGTIMRENRWRKQVSMQRLQSQSRMCGEEVGLGLFPFDSLESQSYDFDKIEHIKHLYGEERLHKSSFKE